eukprot:644057-Rhodomonas_salina.1
MPTSNGSTNLPTTQQNPPEDPLYLVAKGAQLPGARMSGYSAGFPPYVFETALQHACPHAGHHVADMWVRFTEARLTVLHARA